MRFDSNNSPRGTSPIPAEITRRKGTGWSEYSHVLVPTTLSVRERPAMTLGLQIAAAMSAKVTLLHVVPLENLGQPRTEPTNSMHWLDAIDSLHKAMLPVHSVQEQLQHMERMRGDIKKFVEREAPPHLWSVVDVEAECRAGDVADEVLRFAAENSVDLLILCSDLSRWHLPVVPTRVHRLLHHMPGRVIVVRPDRPERTVVIGDTANQVPQAS